MLNPGVPSLVIHVKTKTTIKAAAVTTSKKNIARGFGDLPSEPPTSSAVERIKTTEPAAETASGTSPTAGAGRCESTPWATHSGKAGMKERVVRTRREEWMRGWYGVSSSSAIVAIDDGEMRALESEWC